MQSIENISIGNQKFLVLSCKIINLSGKDIIIYNTLHSKTNNAVTIISYSEDDLKHQLLIDKDNERIIENLSNETIPNYILLLENRVSLDRYYYYSALIDRFNKYLCRIKYTIS